MIEEVNGDEGKLVVPIKYTRRLYENINIPTKSSRKEVSKSSLFS